MVTRALHDCGLHLVGSDAAELIDAAEDNPEGFWENKAIVACNDELLEATGGAWDRPPALPPLAADDPRVSHLVGASIDALAALGEHEQWGFKDPRTCLTAGYWLDLQPDLRFVICVRHPLEVALSLKRRNQNSYSLGLALWERYYAAVLDLVPRHQRIVTHYDAYFTDPADEVTRLCEFVGLEPSSPRVRRDLRHHDIGIDLSDAGVGVGVQVLYAELCREAGVPVTPASAQDEGRVRRLVLDGAVAQRHAEQRQDAIDRLREREARFRDEHAAAEAELRRQKAEIEEQLRREKAESEAQLRREKAAVESELRQRIRDLEQQLVRDRSTAEAEHRTRIRDLESRLASVRQQSAEQLATLQRETAATLRTLTETVGRTDARVKDIDDRTRHTASRVEVVVGHVQPGPVRVATRRSAGKARRVAERVVLRPGRRAVREARGLAVPTARKAVRRLPEPAHARLRRVRRLVRRGVVAPGPTAQVVARKIAPRVRGAIDQLPPPAQHRARRVLRVARRFRAAPVATASVASRRLPPPARRVVRRAWRAYRRVRSEQRPSARPAEAPRPAPAPKGPAIRQWKAAYEQLVRASVPAGSAWLAVTPGSPREVCEARTPRATPFPRASAGEPLVDDLSFIAQVEASRVGGYGHLVVPEGSREWFRQHAELRDHLVGGYRCVVDRPGAGRVFDLAVSAPDDSRSLRGEVARVVPGGDLSAVLDWTPFDLSAELPGVTTFEPPPGDTLPYLDDSVTVVVVDEARDLREARRVSSLAVIVVAAGASGVEVRAVDASPVVTGPGAAPRALVLAEDAFDEAWCRLLGERVAVAGAELRLGHIDHATLTSFDRTGDHDVVVVVEAGVLPLPGAIARAVELAAATPDSAIAAKVLRADGRLESAGGTVFFDRSVALIGSGSVDVRGAWHDFVRPVCWASGVAAAATPLWGLALDDEPTAGRDALREWAAQLWRRGAGVTYHPGVVGVRVVGDGSEASVPVRSSAWQRVLDLRPARPDELRDGEWRYLLAHDDVEACRA